MVIPTSGSSGAPKEVTLSATALLASAAAAHKFLGATNGEHWSLMLPTHHIAGINVLVRAIALGTDITKVDFNYTSIVLLNFIEHLKKMVNFLPLCDELKQYL